jgi:hypothetical protein
MAPNKGQNVVSQTAERPFNVNKVQQGDGWRTIRNMQHQRGVASMQADALQWNGIDHRSGLPARVQQLHSIIRCISILLSNHQTNASIVVQGRGPAKAGTWTSDSSSVCHPLIAQVQSQEMQGSHPKHHIPSTTSPYELIRRSQQQPLTSPSMQVAQPYFGSMPASNGHRCNLVHTISSMHAMAYHGNNSRTEQGLTCYVLLKGSGASYSPALPSHC